MLEFGGGFCVAGMWGLWAVEEQEPWTSKQGICLEGCARDTQYWNSFLGIFRLASHGTRVRKKSDLGAHPFSKASVLLPSSFRPTLSLL